MATTKHAHHPNGYSALEERVNNLGAALATAQATIQSQGVKIDEKAQTPWATLIGAASLLLGVTLAIGSLAKAPIEADIRRLERDIERGELVRVPRPEHQEIWRRYDGQLGYIQRQIDEQSKKFGETYSLRDALGDLQKRIDKIESKKAERP